MLLSLCKHSQVHVSKRYISLRFVNQPCTERVEIYFFQLSYTLGLYLRWEDSINILLFNVSIQCTLYLFIMQSPKVLNIIS
jgi:hypothetical protein